MSGESQETDFQLDLDGNEERKLGPRPDEDEEEVLGLCGDPADEYFFSIYEVARISARETP